MVALAAVNALLVADHARHSGGAPSPAVAMAAAFQIFYAADALCFEKYYFFSPDSTSAGAGFSLLSSYYSFPFLPTLITRYLIARAPVALSWYCLAGIALVYAVGYVVYRTSETQRCEFARDPAQPALKNLRTIPAAAGRKIIAGGWFGLVRYPNDLGEILIQWAWVLPAGEARAF